METNMKTREFTIKIQNLEFAYDYTLSQNMLQEYIIEDLEIPKEYIKHININNEYLKIKLSPGRQYFNDDWYVNLQRVA
jgi:hypothetical protein